MKSFKKIKKLLELVRKGFKKKSKLLLFLDYDGVLVPLQDNPYTAYLPKEVKKVILNLARNPKVKVALVSGRNLKMLKRLTKLRNKNLYFVGSHGLELLLLDRKKYLNKKNIKAVKQHEKEIMKLAKKIANGFSEDKPYSCTYHIREKKKDNYVGRIYISIKRFLQEKKLSKKITVLKGKDMVEVLPGGISKGKAVEFVIKYHPKYFYVYIGDDVTDISAFKATKKFGGITVSLNPKLNYKADIYLKKPKDVKDFMLALSTTTAPAS